MHAFIWGLASGVSLSLPSRTLYRADGEGLGMAIDANLRDSLTPRPRGWRGVGRSFGAPAMLGPAVSVPRRLWLAATTWQCVAFPSPMVRGDGRGRVVFGGR